MKRIAVGVAAIVVVLLIMAGVSAAVQFFVMHAPGGVAEPGRPHTRRDLAALMPPSPVGKLLDERYTPGLGCLDVCPTLTRVFNVPRPFAQREQCARYQAVLDSYARMRYDVDVTSPRAPAGYAACVAEPAFRDMSVQLKVTARREPIATTSATFEFDASDTGLERYEVQGM